MGHREPGREQRKTLERNDCAPVSFGAASVVPDTELVPPACSPDDDDLAVSDEHPAPAELRESSAPRPFLLARPRGFGLVEERDVLRELEPPADLLSEPESTASAPAQDASSDRWNEWRGDPAEQLWAV